MTDPEPSLDFVHRAMGCMLGAAVGDALGAPFEFGPPGRYTATFPKPVLGGSGEMIGGGGLGWAPGQFTDDTEMAVVVAESLLAHDGIDIDDQLARFRAWGRAASDVGNLTREVLSSGLPADQAAGAVLNDRRGRHTAGNGSLMRAAPGAIRFALHGTEATMAAGCTLSAVTHADPLAQWAVAAQHELIRTALHGHDPLSAIPAVLLAMPAEVRAVYAPLLAADFTPAAPGPGNGSAMGALAQAVWAVRTHAEFADAVTSVIDLGDDTDSVAAVTGALAGARAGIGAIPSRWLTYVHGYLTGLDGTSHRYDSLALQRLAHSLLGGEFGHDTEADEPLLQPAEITPGVWLTNRAGARTVPDHWAVVSLCRIDDTMRKPTRREAYLIDQPGDHNPALQHVVDDALAAIEHFRAEGLDVAVHCYAGKSRTALVAASWLMHQGSTLGEAQAILRDTWPVAHFDNPSFLAELQRRDAAPRTG